MRRHITILAVLAATAVGALATADTYGNRVTSAPSSWVQAFAIPVSDLTASGAFYTFNTPTVTGKRFELLASREVIVTTGGTLSGNGSVAIAQNGADISGPTTLFAASLTGLARPSNLSLAVSPIQDPDMTSFPLQLHVITGLSGSTCTGNLVIVGRYY